VELTVTDGMLHMPEGVVESDIKASYEDGILEIRIPMSRAVAKPDHQDPDQARLTGMESRPRLR
jgi:hypothetical protein